MASSLPLVDPSLQNVRMIEFFSGIGGIRFAVEQALRSISERDERGSVQSGSTGIVPTYTNNNTADVNDNTTSTSTHTNKFSKTVKSPLKSCIAYEISQYANETYNSNFEDAPICKGKTNASSSSFAVYTKLVEQLKPQDLGETDLWTMSPPCQPFTNTRNAKQKDIKDERCRGLQAIMMLLRDIPVKPRWILLENVKGFVGSEAMKQFISCVSECGYFVCQKLICPTEFGIPNHRTRCYILCDRCRDFECNIMTDNKMNPTDILVDDTSQSFVKDSSNEITQRPLYHYLQSLTEEEHQKYAISDDVFEKQWCKSMPVVCHLDTRTHCFTAAYGRQIHRSSGSLLLVDDERKRPVAMQPIDRTDMTVYRKKIRRFTPKELLSLFGFPHDFSFPESISMEHQYKLIGNSVNVSVVSEVAMYLFTR